MKKMILVALTVSPIILSNTATAYASTHPEVIGHRGGNVATAENTVSSVKHSKALGADAAEVDVMFSKDGRAVIMHDLTLDRTTNCTGPVAKKTYTQLKACAVPSLREVMSAAGTMPLYLHIKVCSTSKQAATLVKEGKSSFFMSDSNTILALLHKKGVKPAKLGKVGGSALWSSKYHILVAYDTPVTAALVKKAQSQGHKVIGVESHPVSRQSVVSLGLDGFMANDIDKAVKEL
jgi:glycerophosphoryl diester phosphodiesterase